LKEEKKKKKQMYKLQLMK